MLSPSDYNSAVPQFTNGNYASNPINPLYIEEPGSTDYNRGVEPLQTLPAQWWNWFANQFTLRFNKLNIYVKNIFNELAQLLSLMNITPDGTEGTPTIAQLKGAFQTEYPKYLALLMYPVGSLYWTGKAPNDGGDPNTLFGGTWVQIKGKFIFAKGDSDTLNDTGGSKTVTLTTEQIPSHNHTFTGTQHNHTFTGTQHNHTFTGSEHSHSYTPAGKIKSASSGGHDDRTANESAHESFSGSASHSHTIHASNSGATRFGFYRSEGNNTGTYYYIPDGYTYGQYSAKIFLLNSNSVSVSISGTCTGDHYHNAYFVGTATTLKATQGGTIGNTTATGTIGNTTATGTIGDTGGGQAHDNMPPYVVKYCWERTA